MTSLLDRPHGEYVDLERVITKHLSAESARLLREEPDLAEEVLGENVVQRILDRWYIDGVFLSPERQVAFWKKRLEKQGLRRHCWDAILGQVPEWPVSHPDKGGSSFLALVPITAGKEGLRDDALLSWLQETMEQEGGVTFGSPVPLVSRGLGGKDGIQFVWRNMRHGRLPEQGFVREATVIESLGAILIHHRWRKELGRTLKACWIVRREGDLKLTVSSVQRTTSTGGSRVETRVVLERPFERQEDGSEYIYIVS